MGNKLGRKRQVVDERYTRPQGLYASKDVDFKKLRKLILESKLAPCYPGDEECCHDLEECLICFLYYPSLNRSRCCMKSICTECFLQMKNPNSARPTQYPYPPYIVFKFWFSSHSKSLFENFLLDLFALLMDPVFPLNYMRCPFCKTSNYAVEYRGVKTKEEKGIEQIEEQRVIEAQIRMRQQELQDEERMQKRLESCSSSTSAVTADMEYGSAASVSYNSHVEDGEVVSSQDACSASAVRRPPCPRGYSRSDEFNVDLEDLMVMEAIWLSIEENGVHGTTTREEITSSAQYVPEDRYVSPSTVPTIRPSSSPSSSSPSGGLACAIAALAERQQLVCECESSSNNIHNVNASSYSMFPGSCTGYYSIAEQCIDDSTYPESGASVHGSLNTKEPGSSYAISGMSDGDDSVSENSRET